MTLSVSQARRRLWSMNGRRRALRLVEPAAPERTAPLNSCHRPMPMNRLAGCQGHILACEGHAAAWLLLAEPGRLAPCSFASLSRSQIVVTSEVAHEFHGSLSPHSHPDFVRFLRGDVGLVPGESLGRGGRGASDDFSGRGHL